jgi:hypothetical protein
MRVAFPELLKNVEAARAPFARALREALGDSSQPDLLIFTPADDRARIKTPASVLAITASGWLLTEERPGGSLKTFKADFSDTLWIELTGILLYGRLDIAYSQDSAVRHVVIVFNTVMNEFYAEATERILRGTRGLTGDLGRHARETVPGMTELPFKFRSALLDLTPPGEHVRSLLCWPMVSSHSRFWFRHELAPAGILALTDHTLLIVRDELVKGFIWRRGSPHYGKITTFVPVRRLRGYSLRDLDDLTLVEISLHVATENAETDGLVIKLPLAREVDALAFMTKLDMHGPNRKPLSNFGPTWDEPNHAVNEEESDD